MKRKISILLCFVVLFGCDEFLDEVPDNRQTITTLEDVSELLVSAYSRATYTFLEWRTDNVTAIPENTQYAWLTENYTYETIVSSETQDTPTYLWENNYNAIAHSNQALEALEGIDEGDDDYKDALKGEALITRAYNHFLLASTFCLGYSDANKSALGIPYITAPETSLKVDYDRGTLEETYNLIEADIEAGLPLISDAYYTGLGKYHFNKNAAYAFASRFYLFKGDYDNCIKYSDLLLGSGVIGTTYVRDMAAVFSGSGSVDIANNFTDVNDPTNLLLVRKETLYETRYTRGYRSNTDLLSLIYESNNPQSSSDQRDLRYGYSSSSARVQPKYNELFYYITETTGRPYFIMPELRSEEVILNRMESYVMLDRYADALADYNVMASLRYDEGGQLTMQEVVNYYGGSEKEAMLELVISERRKELLREGIRWFDIKRFDLEVTHEDVFGEEYILTANDLRKAVQIPEKALVNGIEMNPR